MTIQILMPALSPTMEEGTLSRWAVGEGDKVAAGDIITEIETDKATMEVEAVDEGTVGRRVVPEGTGGATVNELIAILLQEGEDESALEGTGDRGDKAGRSGAVPPPDPGPEKAKSDKPESEGGAGSASMAAAEPIAAQIGAALPDPARHA